MLVWLVMAAVWLIDRGLKTLIQGHFQPNESLVLIPKVLHLTYVLNPGAAFGLMAGKTWIFILTAIIVVVLVAVFQTRMNRQAWMGRLAFGLIGGGALGNMYDRLVFSGKVVDYLDFQIWPFVFNFADSMIVIGVCLLLLFFYGQGSRGKD